MPSGNTLTVLKVSADKQTVVWLHDCLLKGFRDIFTIDGIFFIKVNCFVFMVSPAHARFGKGLETYSKFCILSLYLRNCMLHFGSVQQMAITILKFASELDVEQFKKNSHETSISHTFILMCLSKMLLKQKYAYCMWVKMVCFSDKSSYPRNLHICISLCHMLQSKFV